MNSKEEKISGHDNDRSQQLQVIMTPHLQLQTPGIDITTNHSTQASSSIVGGRPRGRPPGSKNISKTPIVVANVNSNPLGSHMIEISSRNDVSKRLFDYSHRQGRGICILNANGEVAQVKVRQSTGMIATLIGRFKIISITGTIHPSLENPKELTICLSDPGNRFIAGSVIPLL
ncbi:hypothetical protein TSUD_133380 [Trifolium subterraneum]|uniref:PPC domain-containing protein n=1 Tax=Trifolium subterraneum TaxID=3900 RepID=A0A2Z6NBD1_TRISU|nr:hypothetical protein TSUD_133380 [Trifolium subterraneum]